MASRVFIECFGMPGVGKTHVSSALVSELESEGIQVRAEALQIRRHSRLRRIARKVSLICTSAPGWWRCLDAIRQRSRGVVWTGIVAAARACFNWLYVLSSLNSQLHRSGVPLLDQGLFQGLWSISYYSKIKGGKPHNLDVWLEDALAALDQPHIVLLVVDADISKIMERLENRVRGGSPLDGGRHQAWNLAELATRQVDECIQRFVEQERITVIRLDNSSNDPNGTQVARRAVCQIVRALNRLG